MQRAIEETERRRSLQEAYNAEHNITPETIRKNVAEGIEAAAAAHRDANAAVGRTDEAEYVTQEYISELETEMMSAADSLEFERAASIRDRIDELRDSLGEKIPESAGKREKAPRKGRGRRRRVAKLGGRIPRPKKPS